MKREVALLGTQPGEGGRHAARCRAYGWRSPEAGTVFTFPSNRDQPLAGMFLLQTHFHSVSLSRPRVFLLARPRCFGRKVTKRGAVSPLSDGNRAKAVLRVE